MMTIVWPLLIYWLVMFVACFVVVEIGQDQLYDEVTPRAGLKVAGGSLLIAALLTALRHYGFPASFESMFTTNIAWTLLQGVVWFLVFMFVFQFHPWHALGLGVVTMVLVSGLATMGVESVLAKPRDVSPPPGRSSQTSRSGSRSGPGRRQSPGQRAGKSQVTSAFSPARDRAGQCFNTAMRRIKIVGYVTREFAHLETLERAKRWLIEVGFPPSRIEVHTHGTLRITVSVEAGQADEVERVLDAVAASDPDGTPSFWDHTHHHHGSAETSASPTRRLPARFPRKPSTSAGARSIPTRGHSDVDRDRETKDLPRRPRLSGVSNFKLVQAQRHKLAQPAGGLDRMFV